MKTVAMIGEGAWGTAVATLLAGNGYTVKLWCHDPAVAKEITQTGVNHRYLPSIKLDKNIVPVTELNEALHDVEWVFEAIPVKYLRSILLQAKEFYSPQQIWVVLSKGIEVDTLLLPTHIIDQIYGLNSKKAVFAGPSYAHEVATKQITAVTIGAIDCAIGLELQKMVANEFFRPYVTLDMVGVQVGAALKNIITLGVGILDGVGYNDNTKTFFITRGLHEMARLAVLLGGRQETIYGLAGVGDLILTSMGRASRNLEVGRKLAQGKSLESILSETGYIPEGINSVQAVYQLALKMNIDLFLCQAIYRIIFEGKQIKTVFDELMAQPLEWECS